MEEHARRFTRLRALLDKKVAFHALPMSSDPIAASLAEVIMQVNGITLYNNTVLRPDVVTLMRRLNRNEREELLTYFREVL